MNNLPLVLLILDGFGLAEPSPGNAITQAATPNFDHLWQNYPHTELEASGLAVGLPAGQMGNSEVGHMNMGAGRVVKQDLVAIDDSITDKTFFETPTLREALEITKQRGSKLHLIGLVSDGGVHSHISHLTAILEASRRTGLERVFVHAIADGRDTAPTSALDFIQQLDLAMLNIGVGKIATVMGRYYAMDRDQRWERIQLAYQAMVLGEGQTSSSAEDAITASYTDQITDEFITPTVIKPEGKIESNDVIICFNFRADRMIQLTQILEHPESASFEINQPPQNLAIFTMTHYSDNIKAKTLFNSPILKRTLGEVLANHNLRQTRIAETEKYAHVTYFFNGGVEQQFKNENRALVPSPKVATYDMQPEMSVDQVADATITTIQQQSSDVLIVNFANCDMVGHTGDIAAAIKAVEAVDQALGRVWRAIEQVGGRLLVTADHGNAEQMFQPGGQPCTTHTTNPVPLIIFGAGEMRLKPGKLADLAPTMLKLLDIKQPAEMTGENLIS